MNRKGKLRMASLTAILLLSIVSVISIVPVAMAAYPACACGDICVNETGWWRVDADFNASNTPIQAAVTGATASETICVEDGSYSEYVNVNTRLTIKSENGAAVTKVETPDPGKDVFKVTTDYVNISGFKIKDATTKPRAGIYLTANVKYCNISYNNATHNWVGIRLNKSSNNTIINNTAIANEGGSGIGIGKSSNNNTVRNNTATSNTKNGIGIGMSSKNNTICDNNASDNEDYGIYVNTTSNDNTICDNTITNNADYGVKIRSSHRNCVYCNTFTDNGNTGHQAWDNSNDNYWNSTDSGKDYVGNRWKDWQSNSGFPSTYDIDGGGGAEDKRPKGLYDFLTSAGTDKWAFRNQTPATLSVNVPNIEFTNAQYSNIKVDEDTRQEDQTSTNGYYAAHRFNFSISESPSSITKINVTWIGIGDHDNEDATKGAKLYIYNFGTPGYELLQASVDTVEEVTLTGEKTSSISSYIGAGNVTVLVNQTSAHTTVPLGISYIKTDYVRVAVVDP